MCIGQTDRTGGSRASSDQMGPFELLNGSILDIQAQPFYYDTDHSRRALDKRETDYIANSGARDIPRTSTREQG